VCIFMSYVASNQTSMEINIDLTRADFADFNKYYFFKRGLKKRIYLFFIMAFVLPLLMHSDGPFDLMTYVISVIIVGPLFALIYLGGMTISIFLTKRLASENSPILGKRKFIITDEGLTEESENSRNLQKWKGIKSIETNKNSIFIFVDNLAAYVIPKRFFKDQAEQQLFIEIIKNKLNNA
jgi:hypothetical protein